MCVSALWTQVEYRSCQLMPWLLMSKQPLPPSETIFLDYVSNWNVVSLYKSIRRKHWLVSLAIGGTLLIQALVVVSTSLFEIRAVNIEYHHSFRTTHSFDGSGFDPRHTDSRAFLRSRAIDTYNLPIPMGISKNSVFQPFQDASQPDRHNYTLLERAYQLEADVDVLSVHIQCEDAEVEIYPTWINGYITLPTANITSDACYSTHPWPWEQNKEDNTMESWLGICNATGLHDDDEPPSTGDLRLWAVVMKEDRFRKSQSDGNFTLTATMCTLRYNMTQGPVVLFRRIGNSSSESDVILEGHREVDPFPSINPGHILYAARRSFMAANRMRPRYRVGEYSVAGFLNWNASIFPRQFEDTLTPIAVQSAHQYMLKEDENEVHGTTRAVETRLFVRGVSFGLMVGILASLITVACSIIYLFAPVAVCSRDPSSIAGLATILSRSPALMESLSDTSTAMLEEMQNLVTNQQFHSDLTDEKFAIRVEGSLNGKPSFGERSSLTWWSPFSARPSMNFITLTVPIIVIIVAEILFYVSKSSNGIALVEGKPSAVQYTWTYIPAVVMFGVCCLFRLLEFNARVFQPFSTLSRGNAPAEVSVLENQHRKIAAYTVFDSLHKRQWALAASTIALLLGGLLPVTVSGLYAVDNLPASRRMNVTERSSWVFENLATREDFYDQYVEKGADNLDNWVAGMILHMNLTYPQWTYEDLAFPWVSITSSDDNASLNFDSGYIQARLPALRANLNCEDASSSVSNFRWYQGLSPEKGDARSVKAFLRPKDSRRCSSQLTVLSFNHLTDQAGYFSSLLTSGHDDRRDPYCMTFFYMFGKAAAANHTEGLTVLSCDPLIEQVEANVRLTIPSYEFDPDYPPQVVPDTSRTLYNRVFPSTTDRLVRVVPDFNLMNAFLADPPDNYNRSFGALDPVTRTALKGINAVLPDELLDTDIAMITISKIYGIVTAQLLSKLARESVDPSTPASQNSTHTALFVDGHDHLVQNVISTHILHALLTTMVICGLISVVCLNTKHVLPKNPCSIGALASLIVDSRMVRDRGIIPEGAEWWGDKELREQGVLVGRRFRMGWWERKMESGERDDDGEGEGKRDVFCIDVEDD